MEKIKTRPVDRANLMSAVRARSKFKQMLKRAWLYRKLPEFSKLKIFCMSLSVDKNLTKGH